MIVSEKQARSKWCPFARVISSNKDKFNPIPVSAHNRAQVLDGSEATGWGFPSASYCLASDCMAWRKRVTADERDKRALSDEQIGRFEAGGYCGLAGRPE